MQSMRRRRAEFLAKDRPPLTWRRALVVVAGLALGFWLLNLGLTWMGEDSARLNPPAPAATTTLPSTPTTTAVPSTSTGSSGSPSGVSTTVPGGR
jgi:hypothetical protein